MGDALPRPPLHDCTERLSAQSTAGVGGLGGASSGGGHFEGARRWESAHPDIRPTIRRLNALAIMVSDGCARVPPGFQHMNLAMIDNLLYTANTLLESAYELMDLVNALNICENCMGNRCPLCAEQITLE